MEQLINYEKTHHSRAGSRHCCDGLDLLHDSRRDTDTGGDQHNNRARIRRGDPPGCDEHDYDDKLYDSALSRRLVKAANQKQ